MEIIWNGSKQKFSYGKKSAEKWNFSDLSEIDILE